VSDPKIPLWERLSAFGTAGQSASEQRRIRLTNQSAAIAFASCAFFATAFLISGGPLLLPAFTNLAAMPFAALAPFVGARGRRRTSRVMILLPVNVVALVATLTLGTEVGFHYYFFVFGAVAFLLFEDVPALKWLFAVVSAAFAIAGRMGARPLIDLPATTARLVDATSVVIVLGTMIFIVHLFTGDTTRAEAKLASEHERSERLLLNILPEPISARLKDTDQPIADGFAEVTVLFADLVGFTELSQKLTPEELVRMLNEVFTAFDELAERHGLEKIKTIGDCYMVAAGLPEPRADHVDAVARMALGMRDALEAINRRAGLRLRLRIGIHTGPVVAGVIGKRKFIYDLWGDTVNTASRMESSGLEQQIQVTREVYERLKDRFDLEPRGVVAVKGKGDMETFLLRGEVEPG
jgi:class 3 adenylate cyclase